MPRITVQPTPNPNSLKFSIDGVDLLDGGMAVVGSVDEAEADSLAARLFALAGVANVFMVPAFVTVTKHPAANWNRLTEAIEQILEEFADESGAQE